MPVHLLPWHVLPGHHQGRTLCFGTLPLTHGFTFQNTGPTSAYPERYLWPWLLRASSSPAACGGHLLRSSSRRGHTGSSRTQARATLGREFPISALSIAKRVPNPAIVHVSCVLSKIPYVEFSPVRLQAEVSHDQPDPSRPANGLKRQVRIPPFHHRFDHAFVAVVPSCRHGGYYQHHQPQALSNDHLRPRVLCSGRGLLSLPSSLVRPDPPVSVTPADFPASLVIPRVYARRPGLGCPRDLPCFVTTLLPSVPPPLPREEV